MYVRLSDYPTPEEIVRRCEACEARVAVAKRPQVAQIRQSTFTQRISQSRQSLIADLIAVESKGVCVLHDRKQKSGLDLKPSTRTEDPSADCETVAEPAERSPDPSTACTPPHHEKYVDSPAREGRGQTEQIPGECGSTGLLSLQGILET